MKSYTDLEQSRKLADILPPETADMEYLIVKDLGQLVANVPFVKDSEVDDSAYSHTYERVACWSLAALLELIPLDNIIDACVEMILSKQQQL